MFKPVKNEGPIDRLVRLLTAVMLFLAAFFWVDGVWGVVLYVVAAVMAFTAATGFCALYPLLKINTLSKAKTGAKDEAGMKSTGEDDFGDA